MLLVEQLADQRSIHPGPLVLRTTSLKTQPPAVDRDQPVSRISILYYYKYGLYHHPTPFAKDIGDRHITKIFSFRLSLYSEKSLRLPLKMDCLGIIH